MNERRLLLIGGPTVALAALIWSLATSSAGVGRNPSGTPATAHDGGDPSAGDAGGVQYTDTTAPAKSDGTPRPASAVTMVLAGLAAANAPSVKDVSLTPGPTGAKVAVTLSSNEDGVRDVWIADLAVGAIAEHLRRDETVFSQVVSSATATGPNKADVPTTTHLGSSPVILGQVFDSPNDSALSTRVADVAGRFGLTLSSLTILHPLNSALDVAFTVPPGPVDWSVDQLRAALAGSSPDVEGILIRLDSPSGTLLVRSGVAYRTGEGGVSFADGQDSRFGVVHSGLARLDPTVGSSKR